VATDSLEVGAALAPALHAADKRRATEAALGLLPADDAAHAAILLSASLRTGATFLPDDSTPPGYDDLARGGLTPSRRAAIAEATGFQATAIGGPLLLTLLRPAAHHSLLEPLQRLQIHFLSAHQWQKHVDEC
jgi:hypothetical protein